MGGIKRGVTPAIAKPSKTKANKKPKIEAKTPPRHRDLGTETDSDPIIESDTTEHSGDDDGVSWPSDGEGMEEDGIAEEESENDGGVDLPIRKPQTSGQPTKKSPEPERGKALPFAASTAEGL